jgi:hypothetical protein
MLIFATLGMMISETNLINQQLDRDKYVLLQANLYIDSIDDYIQSYHKLPAKQELKNYTVDMKTDDNKTFDIFVSHNGSYINIHTSIVLP